MLDLDIVLLAFSAIALVLGLLSRTVRTLPLSEPMAALIAGVLLGPQLLNLVDPRAWGDTLRIVEELARITLAIGLMSVALRISRDDLRQWWRSIALVLALVMPAMWLATGLLGLALLGLPLGVAALLGAVLTPTDPVIASTIVTGRVAEANLPKRIRAVISAESGFNDGLALPFVMLPALLIGSAAVGNGVGRWLLGVVAWQVGGSVVLGLVLGWGAGWLLRRAEARGLMEASSFLGYTLALSLFVLGVGRLFEVDGLLAVFVAGLAFDMVVSGRERAAEERVQEAINRFFVLPIFVLLGLVLPWQDWSALGWAGPAFVGAILLLRRLPAVLAGKALVPALHGWPDALFAGWFGPIGIAALYWAALVTRQTGDERVWPVATMVIAASIIAHGVSASFLTEWYGRRTGYAAQMAAVQQRRREADHS